MLIIERGNMWRRHSQLLLVLLCAHLSHSKYMSQGVMNKKLHQLIPQPTLIFIPDSQRTRWKNSTTDSRKREINHRIRQLKELPSCLLANFWLDLAYKAEGKILHVLQMANISQWVWQKTMESVIADRDKEQRYMPTPVSHILDAYVFVKRVITVTNPMVADLQRICAKQNYSIECIEHVMVIINIQRNLKCWFDTNDQHVLSNAIFRAMKFYKVRAKDLLKGRIFGYDSVNSLTCADLWYLARSAFSLGHFHLCHSITSEILQIVNQRRHCIEEACLADKSRIVLLKNICFSLKNYPVRRHYDVPAMIGLLHQFYSWSRFRMSVRRKLVDDTPTEIRDMYHHLCHQHQSTTPHSCYYQRPKNGWYRVKTELLHEKPDVYRFYDVIHDSETLEFQQQGYHEMKVSIAGRLDDYGHAEQIQDTIYSRSSGTAWITNRERDGTNNELAQRISRRLELITGMKCMYCEEGECEPFQVVNYGMAGTFDPHNDYMSLETQPHDRIATWMFYMEEAIKGGATVFPYIQLAVQPIKGSAVLWYNVQPDGQRLEQLWHAGCPVILGDKWIANKWFLEGGQWQTRKCALTQDAHHERLK